MADRAGPDRPGTPRALRLAFLALAVWGAVHPLYWFAVWFAGNGPDLPGLIAAWHADAATTGLFWDVAIAALTLTLWAAAEAALRRDPVLLLAIPATFGIGVSCGLPLLLFLRSRPR